MSRRIEVELTSTRDDGTWTWRAAGAKQPKGDLDGTLLYDGAKVGDVVRADADFLIDGIVITAVLPPKGARKEPERLEILGPPRRDEQLVTTTLAPKGRGERRGRDGDRREGRGRRDRPEGERSRGDRGDRSGERRERGGRSDRPRPERPAPEPKPKPKRLRAGRVHRNEALAALPEEQRPVAEQVLRGGIPAVRQAVEKQNETNIAEGKPEISASPLLAMAEDLMPALRAAEWRDKAEAALAEVAELDLRDLRSVVVAADAGARDEESRQLAEQLRTALTERVDAEHAAWLAEIDEMLREGRSVRALRLSSRPPKAGAPFPAELATRLVEAAGTSMTAETGPDRFATVIDAVAYSPVRSQVTAQAVPAEPTDELLAAVKKAASRVPQIAAQFGVEAPPQAPKSARPGRPRAKGKGGPRKPPPPAPAAGAAPEAPVEDRPVAPDQAPAEGATAPPAPSDAPPSLEPGAAAPASLDAGEQPAGTLDAGEQPAGTLGAGAAPAEGDSSPSVPPTASEPAAETAAEPAAETAAEPAAETAAEPAAETAAEPAAETAAEPAAETAPEPGPDTTTGE
ncbi:hypothetical protein [Rhabdothermincola salaria]|uniref:hypothetical protein n=1 Tax=Rhabdothermincola salaria TaxID=2903142 RepID=UPI001E2B7590|nr:hypothetical protein [Rhabdothermincola salaria]MCD9623091.1 hypothetical protein [Rhabdothermincola salaria]